MPPPIVTATLQAAVINASSNIVAQAITAYRSETAFQLDYTALAQFTAVAIINTPPAYLWMINLEATFPGQRVVEDISTHPKKTDEKSPPKDAVQKLNVKNTIIKVVIDQTVGATWMSALFLSTMTILRGGGVGEIVEVIRREFFPIMLAGLKLWPLVSILCFAVVPVDKRVLVGSLFGFGWAIYLSLITA
ncbi:putative integral membrane protein, Mpv17/PMP22 family [Talaromyces proteolyticus]|uniref:Integral membrane protein, Mpv17/PMP22 family n=1 Tax=Talaromyces proteolyticus TaxID=1131652 RepID=A0AAD4PUI6_9EURO|nr:putative integral membrane protein, Mpv17/PMP22 family [Talaromyces proteolyticus]KAH8695141.1 putative integral membrane protein, Mpv17/PMP22 family [Talaromyces proteolyticus]